MRARSPRLSGFRKFQIALVVLFAVPSLLLWRAFIAHAQPPDTCFSRDVNDNRSTDVDDFLTGTEDVDVAALGFGADQYFSANSADVVCGNEGPDVLGGESGGDFLDGGDGDDLIAGLGGPDTLRMGPGTDIGKGGAGDDTLRSLTADDVQDDLYDGPGNDVIVGNSEDVWHKCEDGSTDDHVDFQGIIIPDPDC